MRQCWGRGAGGSDKCWAISKHICCFKLVWLASLKSRPNHTNNAISRISADPPITKNQNIFLDNCSMSWNEEIGGEGWNYKNTKKDEGSAGGKTIQIQIQKKDEGSAGV